MRYLAPLAFGLIGCAILIGLGIWQVQRLGEKEAILAKIDATLGEAPVAVPATPDHEADRYRAVSFRGDFTGEELQILASRKGQGAGFRVIAVIEGQGRRLMVDRGFVALEDKEQPRIASEVTITGNLHWPDEVDRWTPEPDQAAGIWFARDVPRMAAALGTEPVLIVARQSSDPAVTPFALDSNGIPNDHLQYAITWFSLAAIWFGMTLYLLSRIRRRTV